VVKVAPTLDALEITGPAGIDMPLGLLAGGWRAADALARPPMKLVITCAAGE